MQNTVRQVGGALGVAIIGTVLATRYAASESLIATVNVLQNVPAVPASVVDGLQAKAFEAFVSATHFTTAISLVIVVIAALLVGFGLPMITPPSKHAALAGPPVDAIDALIKKESADYAQDVGQEYESEESGLDGNKKV